MLVDFFPTENIPRLPIFISVRILVSVTNSRLCVLQCILSYTIDITSSVQ